MIGEVINELADKILKPVWLEVFEVQRAECASGLGHVRRIPYWNTRCECWVRSSNCPLYRDRMRAGVAVQEVAMCLARRRLRGVGLETASRTRGRVVWGDAGRGDWRFIL
jgi:hypothetical protein